MPNERLKVINVASPTPSSSHSNRAQAEARFERLWQENPEQFDPMRNAMERERIIRTQALLDEFTSLPDKKVADLGCGYGILAKFMAEKRAQVLAVDIAPTPLALLQLHAPPNLTVAQDYLPKTILEDDAYDVVLCTEIIAYLHRNQYRLLFSELARLVHAKGCVISSTAIDIYSEDALQRFGDLAETEFDIIQWRFSYHALYIRIGELLSIPKHYASSWHDSTYRNNESERRHGLSRRWFLLHTSRPVGWIWALLQLPFQPVLNAFLQSRFALLKLEQWCQFFSSDTGISHAIFIGKRRPLVEPPRPEDIPQERKHKREVWE